MAFGNWVLEVFFSIGFIPYTWPTGISTLQSKLVNPKLLFKNHFKKFVFSFTRNIWAVVRNLKIFKILFLDKKTLLFGLACSLHWPTSISHSKTTWQQTFRIIISEQLQNVRNINLYYWIRMWCVYDSHSGVRFF